MARILEGTPFCNKMDMMEGVGLQLKNRLRKENVIDGMSNGIFEGDQERVA